MPKPLVIVESPAKARTIAGFLGDDFNVQSSVGHIRDLPASGLNVDTEHDFAPTYEVHATKKDVIRQLKAALKEADELYLATDEDREGEAISWHLLQVLQPKVPVKRMVFHEITPAAIEHAVENWRTIDEGLVDAQETRRPSRPAETTPLGELTASFQISDGVARSNDLMNQGSPIGLTGGGEFKLTTGHLDALTRVSLLTLPPGADGALLAGLRGVAVPVRVKATPAGAEWLLEPGAAMPAVVRPATPPPAPRPVAKPVRPPRPAPAAPAKPAAAAPAAAPTPEAAE